MRNERNALYHGNDMKQILNGLWTFETPQVGRVYAIKDSDGLTLIDTGLASAVAKIIKELKMLNFEPTHVKRIIITHAHRDHIGGLPKLKALTGAKVLCGHREKPYVEGSLLVPVAPKKDLHGLDKLLPLKPQKQVGTLVDEVLRSWERLPDVMGGLQVIDTPGHSPGAISLWQADWRLLFCGDVMMNLSKLRLPYAPFTSDMAENKRSVQRLAELNPSLICFGHGQPMLVEATQELRTFARTVRE